MAAAPLHPRRVQIWESAGITQHEGIWANEASFIRIRSSVYSAKQEQIELRLTSPAFCDSQPVRTVDKPEAERQTPCVAMETA